MRDRIKKRLKKKLRPTKKQVAYIQDYLVPGFKNDCGNCHINLFLSLGLDPWKK